MEISKKDKKKLINAVATNAVATNAVATNTVATNAVATNAVVTFNENHDLVEMEVEEQVINGKKTCKVISERVVQTEERVNEFFSMPKDLQMMLFCCYASTTIEENETWSPHIIEICNRLKVRLEGMEDNGYPLVKTQLGIPTEQIKELFK